MGTLVREGVIVSFIHGRRKQSATLGMYLKAVETHLTSLTKIPLLIESEKTAGWSIFHSQKQTSVAPAVRRKSVRKALVVLCALASLVAQMPRKLCIFAQHVECTCNKMRGNSKATCFSKWHTCAHLRSLAKKSTAKNPPSQKCRKSPRREKARGSVVTDDGKRRSTRGKK